jgi:hypothetical protein
MLRKVVMLSPVVKGIDTRLCHYPVCLSLLLDAFTRFSADR